MVKGDAELRFVLPFAPRLSLRHFADDPRTPGQHNFAVRFHVLGGLRDDFVAGLVLANIYWFGQLGLYRAAGLQLACACQLRTAVLAGGVRLRGRLGRAGRTCLPSPLSPTVR